MIKNKYFNLIGLLILLLSSYACSPDPIPPNPTFIHQTITIQPPEVVFAATSTTRPSKTNTPQPTATPSPTKNPTPDYFSQAYPLSKNEYVIPLTVRHISEGKAIFFFELANLAVGKLVYRNIDTRIQEELALLDDEYRQLLTVQGLAPGTEYEAYVILGAEEDNFQLPSFENESWGPIRFRSTSEEWPVRIGILGDASFGDDATKELVKHMATQNLDFILHTGDIVYETEGSDPIKSYALKFYKPFAQLLHQGPIYTVLGNHDYDSILRQDGVPAYDHTFPPLPNPAIHYPETRRGNQYYAIDFQGIQFLMLDTHVFAGAEGRTEQDTWIEERLADPRYRFTIPVFHVAPYSSSIVHPEDGLPVRYSWNWRFEQARVPLVLSGHFHHYERLSKNGITYIVSGGGSSTLYAQGEPLLESEYFARKTHFVLLEISDDQIHITAISLDGEIFDQTLIALE